MHMQASTIFAQYPNTVGIIVMKDGETIEERYAKGYGEGDTVSIYSVTKSVVSALVGIALSKGMIASIDQSVADFFPDHPIRKDITLKHLLTMTAPYAFQEEPYERFFASDNWVDFSLSCLGGPKPVGTFHYSPIVGTHILSGILSKAIGGSILAFADMNLFSPLRINVPKDIVIKDAEEQMALMEKRQVKGWVVDPQGLNTSSWGLWLTTREMARIGQLYIQEGECDGQALVPANWIRESTQKQSEWGKLSYGYLWWVIDRKEHAYAALGDGGNTIYVNEKRGLVVAISSRFIPDAGDRIGYIRRFIEPYYA